LVDIVYQHATEGETFPATHTADLLIDRAFAFGATPSPTAAGRTECGCTDECLHKPDCVFERDDVSGAGGEK
jgi:hypothetical protein